ncbi:MAG: hypothetical protein ABJA87_13165 [bacterium]
MGRSVATKSGTLAFSVRSWRAGSEDLRPSTPPIERVAADARRLRRQLEALPKGTSFVRAIGVAHAYDQVLVLACQQLEIATALHELADGRPRILERLRIEFLLGECGLNL